MVNAGGPYRRGNNYERVLAPPYFRANTTPFWASLPVEAMVSLIENDPLTVTTPNVLVTQTPKLLVTAPEGGLLISSLFAKYTGAQASENSLFIYSRAEGALVFNCIGAIVLAVSADSLPSPSLTLPPILLGDGESKRALRLATGEQLFMGLAQQLTTPIEVHVRAQQYTNISSI